MMILSIEDLECLLLTIFGIGKEGIINLVIFAQNAVKLNNFNLLSEVHYSQIQEIQGLLK